MLRVQLGFVVCFALNVASVSRPLSAQAPPNVGAPPVVRTASDPPRERPSAARALPQGTTDVQVGLGMTFSAPWPGRIDSGRVTTLDLALVHRFRARGVLRVAVEPIAISSAYVARTPAGRGTVLAGVGVGVTRVLAGISGWGLPAMSTDDTSRGAGGVLATGRLEIGQPRRTMLTLEGGTGGSSVFDIRAKRRLRHIGFAGEISLQCAWRSPRRDMAAVRLVSRWFGTALGAYGDTGLDFVVARRRGIRHPLVAFGYRWMASWLSDRQNSHGLRLSTEWYALPARPAR